MKKVTTVETIRYESQYSVTDKLASYAKTHQRLPEYIMKTDTGMFLKYYFNPISSTLIDLNVYYTKTKKMYFFDYADMTITTIEVVED